MIVSVAAILIAAGRMLYERGDSQAAIETARASIEIPIASQTVQWGLRDAFLWSSVNRASATVQTLLDGEQSFIKPRTSSSVASCNHSRMSELLDVFAIWAAFGRGSISCTNAKAHP
jgi:hypothetical protein